MFAKPKQKFELSFQQDISEQLRKMTKHQLITLFFAILSILPINAEFMAEYKQQFMAFFKTLGSILAEVIREKIIGNIAPDIEQISKISSEASFDDTNPYISSLIYGLGGSHLNKSLAGNIVEALFKLVDSEYESHVGWRDSLVTYVKTH